MEEEPESEEAKKSIFASATTLAVLGVVLYGAMSLATAWVYEPTGVSLRDLGLTSGALLGQAAAGLAALLILVCAVALVLAVVFGLISTARSPEFRDPGALLGEASPGSTKITPLEVTLLRGQMLMVAFRLWLYAGFALAILVAGVAFFVVADNSRDAIAAGKQPGFVLDLPLPWSAQIAKVRFSPGSRGDRAGLPACALYLGQADGTILLRDGSSRTIRVPASAIQLDLVDRHEC